MEAAAPDFACASASGQATGPRAPASEGLFDNSGVRVEFEPTPTARAADWVAGREAFVPEAA